MEFTWSFPGEALPGLYPAALRGDLSGFSPNMNNLLSMFSALIGVLWSHSVFGIMLGSFHGRGTCPIYQVEKIMDILKK